MGPDNVYTYLQKTQHIFPEFHSGLIWIQTIFANVNEREREREERERLVYAHPFGEIKVHRRIDKEREREVHIADNKLLF